MKLFSVIALIILFIGCHTAKKEKDLAGFIDPTIGNTTEQQARFSYHGGGKTFPGPCTPFGLVQLSPDTKTGGDNGPGYSWHHKTIEGFSFTHMSGIGWYGDLGNFLVMPATGPLHTAKGDEEHPENGYRSRYSHDSEVVKAGYYAVTLDDYHIRAELTSAPRAGIIRFTFPAADTARIQIDLARRVGGTSTEQFVNVVDNHTIEGWMKCPPEGGGWGNGAGNADYTVYFYCQFSRPLANYGVWSADIPDNWVRKRDEVNSEAYQQRIAHAKVIVNPQEEKGRHLGFFMNFPTQDGDTVLVKSGISFVNIEGARANLANDIPDWDFGRVEKMNRQLWNQALSKIQVEGGTVKQKTIFYSALYHTMIDPRNFSDINGNYIGADGKVHQVGKFTYRTIFSGWDVFRSQFPLQTIINPGIVNDEINSLIQMADLSGQGILPTLGNC